MAPSPDNDAAVAFLRWLYPEGPWVLTAIQVDRKAIETRTFRPGDLRALQKWLERYNGQRNIYYAVNPPLRDVTKKADREDIAAVCYLHVDIDPRAGEEILSEQQRALRLLTEARPEGVPEPSAIIFSGGGYQALWRLEEPIPISGDLARAEDAKRYNQQLELLFGADNVHNIDRILRLPGTVNLPDARKARKGREPVLAELVQTSETPALPLALFTPAASVQMVGEKGLPAGAPAVHVPGNIERLADVNELDQWGVSDRAKIIIVQGRHPDETKEGDNSRSIWLFDAVCSLTRCEVPDEVIYSVITDPDFGISESVLDKGSNAERYALRQIERAKEEVIDPWLRMLNERHAVIGNLGGRCRVVEEVMDHALGRTRLTRQSFEDFSNRYKNRQVQIGVTKDGHPVMRPVGRWWLEHPMRRQYDTVVFLPGREVPDSYNLWRGFGVQARPGSCELFIEHTREHICRGDEELYEYVMNWLARLVQEPASPGEVAIVLRGGRGVGKSLWAREIGRLLGRHFMQVSNPGHLVGQFNAHLRDVVLLFADEAFYAGDRKHTSILKTLITEDTIQIEAKGVDAETAPNYVHLIMASNDMHVIPAGGDERRFLVLDVSDARQQDSSYFSALLQQMRESGAEALLYQLLHRDISQFQVRAVPQTAALQEQKLLSLGPEEEWWHQKLVEGRLLESQNEWEREVRKAELIDDYTSYTDRFRVSRRGNATALGRFLARVCTRLDTVQRLAEIEEPMADGWSRRVTRRTYFWIFPPLEEVRQRWVEQYGAGDW